MAVDHEIFGKQLEFLGKDIDAEVNTPDADLVRRLRA